MDVIVSVGPEELNRARGGGFGLSGLDRSTGVTRICPFIVGHAGQGAGVGTLHSLWREY